MPRSVVPLVPPERSYSSTWSRTHWVGLGSYSPERGMAPANTTRWYAARGARREGTTPVAATGTATAGAADRHTNRSVGGAGSRDGHAAPAGSRRRRLRGDTQPTVEV